LSRLLHSAIRLDDYRNEAIIKESLTLTLVITLEISSIYDFQKNFVSAQIHLYSDIDVHLKCPNTKV